MDGTPIGPDGLQLDEDRIFIVIWKDR